MTSSSYMNGRKKFQRPQAALFANNSGTLQEGTYIPLGSEVGAAVDDSGYEFLILSDNNRDPLDFSIDRIEQRQRMINGRMRSYHVADKLNLSISWSNLPSRSYASMPDFDPLTGKSAMAGTSLEFTTDGGAGGVELLDWHERYSGSFWVYLAYDKYSNFGKDEVAYGHLAQYNQIVEMFVSDFSYTVSKRGGTNYDFWNVSISLEEV